MSPNYSVLEYRYITIRALGLKTIGQLISFGCYLAVVILNTSVSKFHVVDHLSIAQLFFQLLSTIEEMSSMTFPPCNGDDCLFATFKLMHRHPLDYKLIPE